jgi:hypothetical protein
MISKDSKAWIFQTHTGLVDLMALDQPHWQP